MSRIVIVIYHRHKYMDIISDFSSFECIKTTVYRKLVLFSSSGVGGGEGKQDRVYFVSRSLKDINRTNFQT
jgi:hypothetical protein